MDEKTYLQEYYNSVRCACHGLEGTGVRLRLVCKKETFNSASSDQSSCQDEVHRGQFSCSPFEVLGIESSKTITGGKIVMSGSSENEYDLQNIKVAQRS